MLKAILTIGTLQVVTMGLLLVRTKATAVLLGPELVGAMAVIDRFTAVFIQTASFSLPFAAIRFLPALWQDRRATFTRQWRGMRTMLGALLAAAAVVALAVAVLAPGWVGREMSPYRTALLVALATVPVLGFVPFLQNVLAARFEHRNAMLLGLAHAAVLVVAATLGVLVAGLVGFYAVYAVAGGLVAVGGLRAAGRGLPAADRTGAAVPRTLVAFGVAMLSVAFLTPFAALYVYQRVLVTLGAEAAGWMQAGVGIALAVRGVLGAAHAVLLTPHVNRGGTPAERMAWADRYQRILTLVAGGTVPVVVLFPDLVVRVLYTGAFVPGAAYVALFVAVELLGLTAATYQSLIVAYDHLRFHVAQNVLAQLVMVGVAAVLISRVGILGAAVAGLAAQAVLLAGTTGFLRWRYGLRLPASLIRLLGFIAVALGGAGALGVLHPGGGVATVGIKLVALAAATVPLLAFLTTDERARLRRLAARAGA